jgi:hypothetical protein
MTVKELIEKLQTMPQDACVHMGYDGNYVSTTPTGEVFVVQPEDNFLCANPGDVFIEGA